MSLRLSCVMVCLALAAPCACSAQSLSGTSQFPAALGTGPTGPWSWPSDFAGFGWWNPQRVRFDVEGGLQATSFSLNIPIPEHLGTTGALDLSFKDSGVWVGGATLDIELARGWVLYAGFAGNFRKNVTVRTPEEPLFLGTTWVRWKGSKLEWWQTDGGVTYSVGNGLAVLGGFRFDHLNLGLRDPVGPFERLPDFITVYYYGGDIETRVYTPYFGVQVSNHML